MCSVCKVKEKVQRGKCGDCYREYMRNYVRERYHRLRKEWLDKLGGECVRCGSTEDLNFDHINAEEKTYSIAKILSTHSKQKVEKEMAKCQILCEFCHIIKSAEEGDIYTVEHGGGLTGKKNCRCELCGPLKNAYYKEYRKVNKPR